MGEVLTLEHVAGADMSDELAAVLDSVAQATVRGAPKYPPRLCRKLVRAVICRTYAGPIFELTQLIAAAHCIMGGRGYESLFWDQGPASAARFRESLERALTHAPDAARHVSANGAGLHVTYPDGAFTISFARMPFLSALLDVLVAAIGYAELDDTLRSAIEPASPRAEQTRAALTRAANRLTRSFYAYLKPRLSTAQEQRKFRALMVFLRKRAGDGRPHLDQIDDDALLDFWRGQAPVTDVAANGGDWKTFRSVFSGFVHLRDGLAAAADRDALHTTLPIDPERDGEAADPLLVAGAVAAADRRKAPLEVLKAAPAKAVKFLTKREADTISTIIASGEHGRALPLSLLRAEVFGAAQSAITQSLRAGTTPAAAVAEVEARGALTYDDKLAQLDGLEAHLGTVLQAACHVLARARHGEAITLLLALQPAIDLRPMAAALPAAASSGGHVTIGATALRDEFFAQAEAPADCPELAGFMSRAAEAHRKIARKGFSAEDARRPGVVAGFAAGGEALLKVRDGLGAYLERLRQTIPGSAGPAARFAVDHDIFFSHFRTLYGGTP